jgi:preprotein translocase subunit YajC
MKNTSSLFLTLVSYLIMLAAILFMLFAAIPMSLKAQTNADMVATNTAVTNAAITNVAAAAVEAPQAPQAPSVHVDRRGAHGDGLGLGNTIVATMPFIFPVAIIAVIFYFKHRRNMMAHDTLRMMIEKGVPVTPEVIAALRGRNGQDKDGSRTGGKTGLLLAGLILTGIGIGVIAVAGKPGLIVMFIGVAFLIVWFIEGRKQNDQQPPKQ